MSPVVYSDKLYTQVPVMTSIDSNLVPPNIPPASNCDNISAVKISGIEDYSYANF